MGWVEVWFVLGLGWDGCGVEDEMGGWDRRFLCCARAGESGRDTLHR